MIELLTTDEFAEWFSALDEGAAEDVAETLEVIAQLGTRTEAPGSSEWLLWYEDRRWSSPGVANRSPPYFFSPAILDFIEDWGIFVGYVKRVLKHLESPQFVARLRRLDPRNAAAVADAVDRIRRASKTRHLALSEFQRRRPTPGLRPPTAADASALEHLTDLTDLRQAYFAALAAAGFAVVDVPAHSTALREVALRSRAPGLRLLYGVDTRRSRGLVVVGEWLDRRFYGDSVRRGEQLWRQFLDGHLQVTRSARSP
jgi:hypothetical protein